MFLSVLRKGACSFWFGVCTLLLVLGSMAASTAQAATIPHALTMSDTWNNIHTLMVFDYHISKPKTVAPRYDAVTAAGVAHVAAYKAANPNMFLTYYMPFHRDNGTFTNSQMLQNASSWKTLHPTWILYKCDRVTPAYEFRNPNMPLDFSNPAVIAWQVQNYALPASQMGYDGIQADNLNLENMFGACGTYDASGNWVQRYTGQQNDPQWLQDVIIWVTQMQAAMHNLPHPLALIPNLGFGSELSVADPNVQQVLNSVDGVLDEAGFTHYGTGYLTDSDWLQKYQLAEQVQAQGKPFFSINDFNTLSRANIQWALASYLMIKEHSCALFITRTQNYGIDAYYNEYKAQIGSPTAAMYESQGVYMRDYSNGLSIVNPSSQSTFTVNLNSSSKYVDLYGNAMGSTVTLAPHTGIVLLLQGQAPQSSH